MQTTLNLLFWQKKNKINKKEEAPIWIRLTIDGKRTEISTGIFAPPSKWNQRKQQIVGRTSEVQALNNSLANVRTKLLQLHNRLIESDKPVTGASIKELYTGKEQGIATAKNSCWHCIKECMD